MDGPFRTLFVADDNAYARFFKQNKWGVSSYEGLTLAQKKLLLYGSMINNSCQVAYLSSSEGPTEGDCMRRLTSQSEYDSIPLVAPSAMPETPYWQYYRDQNKTIPVMMDATTPPMIHFIEMFLNNQLSDYNCKTNWREIFGATYSNIKSMLDNNIPVIIAFYRHDKSGLRFYKANSNSTILEQVDSVESHYFIVTGIYENPNKPGLHYLEISTWGDRQYICFEEYQNGRGLSLFSTVLELSIK